MKNLKNLKVLISPERLEERVKELAEMIKKDYGHKVFCSVVLTGAMVFFTNLMKELKKINVEVIYDPIKVSSYSGTESTGKVNLELDMKQDIKNKRVLIVEDIIDTGLTLKYLKEYMLRKGAAEVKICSLLDKKARRKEPIEADYVGFEIPDKFIVGYGVDYNERFRDLNFIGYFSEE